MTVTKEMIEAALEAYAEGVYLTDGQVRASVIRIVEAALPFVAPIAGEGKETEQQAHVVAWLYEDELPVGYPYNTMFPFSKVDGVRMFPVYAPSSQGESDV